MITKEKIHDLQKKLGSLLSTLALMISIVLCGTVVIQVMTNGYVQFGGISVFRVITGSMEPTLHVGSLLVCKDTDIGLIEQGDIVCFRSRSPQMMGKVITHRVVNILESGEGEILLETKGDANLSADGELVSQSNLIGRVDRYTQDNNFMASVVDVMTDKIGFLVIVLFPTLLIAGFILRTCISNMRKDIEIALEEEKRSKEAEKVLYTDDEYNAMLERLKSELLEEMKQDVEEHDEQTAEDPESGENAKTE